MEIIIPLKVTVEVNSRHGKIEVPPNTSKEALKVVHKVEKNNVAVYQPDDSPEQQAVAQELLAMSGYSCLKVWREGFHILWIIDQDTAFEGETLP